MLRERAIFEAWLGATENFPAMQVSRRDPCSERTSDRRPNSLAPPPECRGLSELKYHPVLLLHLRLRRSSGLPYWQMGLQEGAGEGNC
jgi:hypothetical protein